MEINNLMIDRLNAEKELHGKIAEMLMPMHPEAADLKAGEIKKLVLCYATEINLIDTEIEQHKKTDIMYEKIIALCGHR